MPESKTKPQKQCFLHNFSYTGKDMDAPWPEANEASQFLTPGEVQRASEEGWNRVVALIKGQKML
ncbi:MAG: hypothetical protein AAGU11_18100 [Syntrophobacteraceae bacterium]